jgi:hypothetical protein
MMEAVIASETLMNFYQTRNIPEDSHIRDFSLCYSVSDKYSGRK